MAKKGDIKGYFPPISRRDLTPAISEVGRWEYGKGSSFLDHLIQAMPPGMDLSLADLVSLPHIWGQTVAFTTAWKDEEHPMHKTVLSEWRGLLALIGLAVWENWPVRALKVDMVDLAERPFVTSSIAVSDNTNGQRHGNFPKVVRDYMPDRAALNQSEWNDSAVILYDKLAGSRKETRLEARPIAFCVPTSLVVPARNYENVIDNRISWRANKRGGYPLQDPLKRNGHSPLTPLQCSVLEHYLSEVLDKVISGARTRDREPQRLGRAGQALDTNGKSDEGLNVLKKRLEEYIEDIQAVPSDRSFRLRPTSESLDGWDTEWFSGFTSPFLHVLASVPQRPQEHVAKETLIPCTRDRDGQFKGVILFGDKLKEVNSARSGDILVWGPHTLKDLGNEPIHFSRINRVEREQESQPESTTQNLTRLRVHAEAKRKGYLLLHESELFYSEITAVSDPPKSHPPAWGNWLPPLRPLALALFSPEFLRKNLVIDDLGNTIRVTIRLRGIENIGTGLGGSLSKTFSRTHGTVLQRPATFAMWPNFKSPEWHHYYLFHIGNLEQEIDIIPMPTVEEWLKYFYEEWQDRGDVNGFFEKLGSNTKLVVTDEEVGRDRRLRTHWLSQPPEALIGVRVSETSSTYGLILLDSLETLQLSDKPAVIGLDIGSTNTSAAWSLPGINDSEGKRAQVEFCSMLSFPFASSSQDAIEIEATFGLPHPSHDAGLPHSSHDAPYLSLLRERRPVSTRTTPHPFIHYRIPWQILTKREFPKPMPNRRAADIFVCDLKWMQRDARSDSNFEAVERYLWLVMLQVGAAVIREKFSLRTTEWRFSYPDTFTTAEVDSYRDIIDTLNLRLHNQKNDRAEIPPRQVRRTYAIREYECSGKYFLKRYDTVARSNTVIIFDVGGHNTDVSIWESSKDPWNATLALASQDTLVDFMMRNSDLFNQMFPNDWANYDEILRSRDYGDDFKRLVTEIFIQDEKFTAWQERMRGPQRDFGRMSQLRDMTNFTLAGLLYYVAMAYVEAVVKKATTSNTADPYVMPPIQFCFGGKGSLLFKFFIDHNQHNRLVKWFYKKVKDFAERQGITVHLPVSSESSDPQTDNTKSPDPARERQVKLSWICPPFIFSNHPKHEVSEGLLSWEPFELERRLEETSGSGLSTSNVPKDPSPQCCAINPRRKDLYIGDTIKPVTPNAKARVVEKTYNQCLSSENTDRSDWQLGDLSEVKKFLEECEEEFRIFPKIADDDMQFSSERVCRLIQAGVQRALDEECRCARNDYRRYHRSGDSLTYQPQPVFILALKDIIRQWNKQNQRPMG